ncbi:hypothetical protein [Mesoplasma syrphidae]|uniref:hypothetical protein n=1 Tax=Mesoplasma syrphidae TaxID=225999 RepID=UPI00047CCA35|nr:hypothetical protein [Mesoplasma syrphidae]
MKKILAVLWTLSVGTTTTISVVACTPIEPKNVIVEIENNVAKPTSDIFKAWVAASQSFNEILAKGGKTNVKVEVVEAPQGDIKKKMYSNEALPNIFVSYADDVTFYETQLGNERVVDMRKILNWDGKWIDELQKKAGIDSSTTNTQKTAASGSSLDIKQYEQLKEYRNNATQGNSATYGKGINDIYVDLGITPEIVGAETLFSEQYRPLTYSFISEGMGRDGKMYVAPTGKSLNYGMANKRLIAEIVYKATDGELDLTSPVQYPLLNNTENPDELWVTNDLVTGEALIPKMGEVFGPNTEEQLAATSIANELVPNVIDQSTQKSINLYSNQNIKELIKKWFAPAKSIRNDDGRVEGITSGQSIQNIFADADKTLVLLTAYQNIGAKLGWNFFNSDKNQGANESTLANPHGQMFSYSIDDAAGYFYGSDRNTNGNILEFQSEDPNDKKTLVSWSAENPDEALDLHINDQTGKDSVSNGLNFFEYMNAVAKYNGKDEHYGGLKNKGYGSDYLQKGTMLATSGSSAGAKYAVKNREYQKISENNYKIKSLSDAYQIVADDVMPIASPGFYREPDGTEVKDQTRRQFGLQQGPGAAMFKSYDQTKQNISIAFLNYFTSSRNLSEFSRKAGYISSAYYSYYEKAVNESDQPKLLTPGTAKISYDKDKVLGDSDGQYYQNFEVAILSQTKNGDYVAKTPINADKYIKQIVDGIIQAETNESANEILEEANLTQLEKDIRGDQGILYSQIPSPYGNGIRFNVIRDFVNTWYNTQVFAEQENRNKENSMTWEAFMFWGTNSKYNKFKTTARAVNPRTKIIYESEIRKNKGVQK